MRFSLRSPAIWRLDFAALLNKKPVNSWMAFGGVAAVYEYVGKA